MAKICGGRRTRRSSPAASPTLFQMESLAGAQQPARPDQDLHHARVRRLALAARVGGRALHRPRPCRASSRAGPTAPSPTRSRSSTSRRTPRARDSDKYTLGQRRLRDGGEHQPLVQALRLVLAHPRHRVGRRGRGPADAHLPHRRRRRGHEVPDRDRASATGARPSWPRTASCRSCTRRTPTSRRSSARSRCRSRRKYDDPDATANANLSARLPYLFATCRFAHYLKCIVRDKVGSFKERDDMQRWLQNWITQYVDGDPAHASEESKAREAAGRGRGRGRGGRGQPWLLQRQVLPAPALPARGPDRVAAAGLEAAVREAVEAAIAIGR